MISTNLIELQLSNNHLKDLKGLEKLQNLKILYLLHNQLSEIKELDALHKLKELWINDSNISEGDIERLKKRGFKIHW
ncbi:MAG: leucine-rich repeat domain-containing protein [Promethearchaeota archaeon]